MIGLHHKTGQLYLQKSYTRKVFDCSCRSMTSFASGNASYPALVSADTLLDRMKANKVKILDASWYLPGEGRQPLQEFKESRIPGSKFFDVHGISDKTSSLPHMLPNKAGFAAAMDVLGINNSDEVVVYDRAKQGLFSAARAWWMFKVFGHDAVSVLQGGMNNWKERGHSIETSEIDEQVISQAALACQSPPVKVAYQATFNADKVVQLEQVRENISTQQYVHIDARPAARFNAQTTEPRPGMRDGHVPGSVNVPFSSIMVDGQVGDKQHIDNLVASIGVDTSKPIIVSCGSGVTACGLALALYNAGVHQVSLYDGSWSEWGARQDTPVD